MSFPVSYQGGHGVRAGGFVVVVVVVCLLFVRLWVFILGDMRNN